jgi:multidrug efflux pump
VEQTLVISVALVILVVFLFLRSGRATLIPAVAVPVSLIGTFAAMYLCGFSLNNLSLMALTIATGFVVDDAIVVLEISPAIWKRAMKPLQAALQGTREVGFTVLSMSLSLVAVFLPLLLMGGLPGACCASLPSPCRWRSASRWRSPDPDADDVRLAAEKRQAPRSRRARLWPPAGGVQGGYGKSLKWVLNHSRLVGLVLLGTIALNVWLYIPSRKPSSRSRIPAC